MNEQNQIPDEQITNREQPAEQNAADRESQPTQAPNPPSKPPKKSKKWWIAGGIAAASVVYLLVVALLMGAMAIGALSSYNGDEDKGQESIENQEVNKEENKEQNTPIKENTAEEGGQGIVNEDYTGAAVSAAKLYEDNVSSVVFVEANYRQGQSTGSGFVIDSENGYLLTNCHVVEGAEDVAVTFSSGDSYTAQVLGTDSINDIAVLKVNTDKLKLRHVTIGDSDKIKIGEDVLVIGNPLGDLTFTLTKGVVSGVDRSINTGEYNINTFQTDAAINSGNSGGPAFDATGAVIGIASAKYAATGVEGICFCIPINDAMEVARDLVEHGYVTGRPNFGIAVSDSSGYEYTTDEWGRRVIVETMRGAKVEQVGKDSCAEKAGLKVGDVITKLGDKDITTANELINEKNKYKAGDKAELEVWRDGKKTTLTVTFDEYTPE